MLDGPDVFFRGIDEWIDVPRTAREAVEDDGEAADQEVAGAGFVESSAELGQVFEFRRAWVAAI